MSTTCDRIRSHLGDERDGEATRDAAVDGHLATCAACAAWVANVDAVTRALRVQDARMPTFVAGALAAWDRAHDRRLDRRLATGRALLALAAAGCLVVGVLIASGSAGHTHIGLTAQREAVVLEVALAFGLACAAIRPRLFLAGLVPVLGVIAVVNAVLSLVNVATHATTLVAEVAHLPFALGLAGAALTSRALRRLPAPEPSPGRLPASAPV